MVLSNGLHTDYVWVFTTFRCICINKLFQLSISLEHIYNKLQFRVRISSFEVSKQKLRIALSLYDYNKTYDKEIHPARSDSFLKSEGIHSVFQ